MLNHSFGNFVWNGYCVVVLNFCWVKSLMNWVSGIFILYLVLLMMIEDVGKKHLLWAFYKVYGCFCVICMGNVITMALQLVQWRFFCGQIVVQRRFLGILGVFTLYHERIWYWAFLFYALSDSSIGRFILYSGQWLYGACLYLLGVSFCTVGKCVQWRFLFLCSGDFGDCGRSLVYSGHFGSGNFIYNMSSFVVNVCHFSFTFLSLLFTTVI